LGQWAEPHQFNLLNLGRERTPADVATYSIVLTIVEMQIGAFKKIQNVDQKTFCLLTNNLFLDSTVKNKPDATKINENDHSG
jgi:hypothetical protein